MDTMTRRSSAPPGTKAPGTNAAGTDTPAWHALSAAEAVGRMDSSHEGLSGPEAAARLERHGPNRLTPPPKVSALRRFLRQFGNALIAILIPAAAVMALIGEYVDAAVVLAVVVINALIGFVQEGKAEQALDAIRDMLSPQAAVLRDRERRTVRAEELVPGDVVLLAAGDKVPADLRLIEVKGLEVQEAALTGESLSVAKSTEPVAHGAALGDRVSSAFSGTLVTRGAAKGLVTATGDATEIGRIGALLSKTEQSETPLMAQIGSFGRWLTAAILGLGAGTFAVGVLLRGYSAVEMFQAAVGLAVAAIPEGLPAILTITLAIGVTRMAGRKAIIRRMPAVETLGAVSVICTDKTGTLTRNEMTVRTAITATARWTADGVGYAPEGALTDADGRRPEEDALLLDLARCGLLCNDAQILRRDSTWTLEGDPVDGAILALAGKAGLDARTELSLQPRVDAVPFESDRAYMATLNAPVDGDATAYVKGAPEAVLARCSHALGPDGPQPIDRARWAAEVECLAREGQRVIAAAVKDMPDADQIEPRDLDGGLLLLGLFGLIDPPRQEALDSVRLCAEAGIQVKMITGDHAVTARAIGEAVGLKGGVIAGPELDRLDEDGLARAALENAVFARATPEHKIRLVDALRRDGRIVAMTGDGVNDAPALKRADVGVAMGAKGTEAAKEASDMVLADDNFATIVRAVEEGRTVYDNLRKALIYVLPTSFGQAGIIVIAVLAGMVLPITPLQVLWVNLVTAVTLSIGIAFDPSEAGIMRRTPRPPTVPLLSGFLLWRIGFVTSLMVAGCLWVFIDAMGEGRPLAEASTLVVNALVLFEAAYLFNCRSLYAHAFRRETLFGNRYTLLTVGAVLLLQLGFTYLGPLQAVFGTAGIGAGDWLELAGLAAVLFLIVEVEKWVRAPRRKAA